MEGISHNSQLTDDQVGQKVELYISCRKLKDLDTFSKSDPQVRLYIKENPAAASWKKVGETEVLENNLNPDFKRTLQVFYVFEISQQIRFEVVDSDGGKSADVIGLIDTSLGQVVGAKEFTFKSDITLQGKKEKRGEIIVRVAKIQESTMDVTLKLGARDLPVPALCCLAGAINPFIGIDKTFQAGGKMNFVPLHKTEVSTSGTNSPSFQTIKLKGQDLCNSDLNQII